MTSFDTAPDYRHSEPLLGQALAGRRARVVLATKCGRRQRWTGHVWEIEEDWTERGVRHSIERSLRRLRTDYLDLVQLHSPPRWVLEDGAAVQGLLRAQAAGQVRSIGVSADGAEACRALELGVFATLQVSYNILHQAPAAVLLPAAAAQGVGLIIKQPVANAIMEMQERTEHADWAVAWDLAERMQWDQLAPPGERVPVALRWLLADPLVSMAIVGTTRLDHLVSNRAAATAPPLDPSVLRRIRAAYGSACAQQEGDAHP